MGVHGVSREREGEERGGGRSLKNNEGEEVEILSCTGGKNSGVAPLSSGRATEKNPYQDTRGGVRYALERVRLPFWGAWRRK